MTTPNDTPETKMTEAQVLKPCLACREYLIQRRDRNGFYYSHVDRKKPCIFNSVILQDEADLVFWNESWAHKEISRLEAEVKAKPEQINLLLNKLDDTRRWLQNNEAQLTALREENERLRVDVTHWKQAFAETSEDRDRADKELEAERQRASDLEADLKRYKDSCDEGGAWIDELTKELAEERSRSQKLVEALTLISNLPVHRNNCEKHKPDGSYCERCFVDIVLAAHKEGSPEGGKTNDQQKEDTRED